MIHGVQRPRMPAEAKWDTRGVREEGLGAARSPHPQLLPVLNTNLDRGILCGGSGGGPGCCGCMEAAARVVAAIASWCLGRLAARSHSSQRVVGGIAPHRPAVHAPPISHLTQALGMRCALQEIRSGGYYMGKVVVELKQDVAPTTCDNFRQLCEFKCYTGSMMQVWPEQRIEVSARRALALSHVCSPTQLSTRLPPSPAASQPRRACVCPRARHVSSHPALLRLCCTERRLHSARPAGMVVGRPRVLRLRHTAAGRAAWRPEHLRRVLRCELPPPSPPHPPTSRR